MSQYVILHEAFNNELHSVWGPFNSATEAQAWIDSRPHVQCFVIHPIENPDGFSDDYSDDYYRDLALRINNNQAGSGMKLR